MKKTEKTNKTLAKKAAAGKTKKTTTTKAKAAVVKKTTTPSAKVCKSKEKIVQKSTAKKEVKKRKSKNEFRYNNQTKHPNYVFEEQGKKYHSIGITHSEITNDKKNMPLKKNPKKKDERAAYARNGIITDKKKNYSKKPIKNLKFDDDDFKNVKSKIRDYKKRRKKSNKKGE